MLSAAATKVKMLLETSQSLFDTRPANLRACQLRRQYPSVLTRHKCRAGQEPAFGRFDLLNPRFSATAIT
jgi:hypothetical protein